MFISLNWLKDFVKIPSSITPEELGLRLTTHTVEIDGVEKQADKFRNIVVGKILEIKKHPDADRLQIVKVDVGKGKVWRDGTASPIIEGEVCKPRLQLSDCSGILNIVCGAPNIKKGQLVPVALIGAILPNGIEIKEAEVRGEKSFGMLCAEDELGLGDDHSGIMILEKGAKSGQNLAEYLKLKDIIFEVDNKSITNRPDLWGHYGMAREISAFLGVKLKPHPPAPSPKQDMGSNLPSNLGGAGGGIDVKVEDKKLCPRYMAVAMDRIKIEDSPAWMRERLIAVGMRPINNIVDITNYVMLELGQPLHAFDASLINRESDANNRECKIIVRRAKKGEVMETLDGEKRELDEKMLVIANSEKAIAIAGIMGGVNSEISNESNSIIIECANFDFVSIRKTSQKLGLRTEASMRFEKGLDPNLCELALARTVELIKKACPKVKVTGKLVDEKKFALNQGPIKLNLDWLNKRLGETIEEKKVISILENLGFGVEEDERELKVTVPTWRATRDISIPEDLVEEVVRIFGYNNLDPVMPMTAMNAPKFNQERLIEREIKNILSGGAGLSEVYNYSFVGEDQLKKFNIDFFSHIKLANPIISNQTMLRQSLAPNLINNIRTNQAKFEQIKLFEIGSIYSSTPGEINKDNSGKGNLPYQEKRLGIILSADKKADAFSQAKGVVEYLLSSFGLQADFSEIETKPSWADSDVVAEINSFESNIGLVAELDEKIARAINIKKQVAIAEISLREIYKLISKHGIKKYHEYEKYPPLVRDLAFVVDQKMLYNNIRDEIINFNELIKSVELFDIYQGEKLGRNKKSLAFHIVYQANKTLTAKEIDVLQKQLTKRLEEKFEAKIRDF